MSVSRNSSTGNERKPSLLKRHKSQLFQNVAKISIKRSLTTKARTSSQISRSGVSSPANTCSEHLKSQDSENELLLVNQAVIDNATNNILSSHHNITQADHNLVFSFPSNSDKVKLVKNRPSVKINSMYTHNQQRQNRMYNSAFLSSIASEMKKRLILSDRIKNDILYNNVFDGKEAVDTLMGVLGCVDRIVALSVGRALESQRFFHDVNYENRLIDDMVEIYQFNELLFHTISTVNSDGFSNQSVTSAILHDYTTEDNEDGDDAHSDTTSTSATLLTSQHNNLSLPTGVYTELTGCYSATCNYRSPCYSYTCPKRERLRNRHQSVDTREKRVTAYTYELQKEQQLWSHTVEEHILKSTPNLERKRQETIFELIYTELDFLRNLNYIITMWVEPLTHDDIIPANRRNGFINQVFSNTIEIRNVSNKLALALTARQSNHPIISQVSDIMEEFISELDPFIFYGSRQHCAKYAYEHERYNNPKFAAFAEQTERNSASRKLELNGYLTKPTNRLGKYPILLERIHAHTLPNHPDKEHIPRIIKEIKRFLSKVNHATGTAKTRFELEQIHQNISFKNKKDMVDLRLLDLERCIIKQGILRKTASSDSAETQLILFDHYLVFAKKKIVHAVVHYIIQKRPIPVELLGVIIPPQTSTSPVSSSTSTSRHSPNSPEPWINDNTRSGSPIRFYNQGRNGEDAITLYAPDEVNRKAWNDVIQKQREAKFKRKPVFEIVDIAKRYEFFADIKAHHMVLFDEGRQYLLATDTGIYMGPNHSTRNGVPHKILPLENVRQIHVLEDYQLLLVLADNVLWQYPLDITVNGRPDGSHSIVYFGRKIRSNVPFFHVGDCLGKTLICVPRPSPLVGTEIDIFEPTMPKTEKKKKSIFSKLSMRSSQLMNTQVVPLKPIYNPFDVWAIDNTASLLILTSQSGISAVEMKTKTVHQLLDPDDMSLKFATKLEKVDDLSPIKKLSAIFQVPSGNYLVCYDKYAFYIDKRGRRAEHQFKIEWEGNPTAFSYYHPYIIAFEHQFIEIRNVIDGHLEQIIQEKNVYCLQKGLKVPKPAILGTMNDKTNTLYQHIFELKLFNDQHQTQHN